MTIPGTGTSFFIERNVIIIYAMTIIMTVLLLIYSYKRKTRKEYTKGKHKRNTQKKNTNRKAKRKRDGGWT